MTDVDTQREGLDAYLRRLRRALNRRVSNDGTGAYEVEVSESGLTLEDAQLLR